MRSERRKQTIKLCRVCSARPQATIAVSAAAIKNRRRCGRSSKRTTYITRARSLAMLTSAHMPAYPRARTTSRPLRAPQVARIWCECIRPHVPHSPETPWGGFDYCTLRLAGLARSIQSRQNLHSCTLRYCLKNRSSCRFFFPCGALSTWSSCRALSQILRVHTLLLYRAP